MPTNKSNSSICLLLSVPTCHDVSSTLYRRSSAHPVGATSHWMYVTAHLAGVHVRDKPSDEQGEGGTPGEAAENSDSVQGGGPSRARPRTSLSSLTSCNIAPGTGNARRWRSACTACAVSHATPIPRSGA